MCCYINQALSEICIVIIMHVINEISKSWWPVNIAPTINVKICVEWNLKNVPQLKGETYHYPFSTQIRRGLFQNGIKPLSWMVWSHWMGWWETLHCRIRPHHAMVWRNCRLSLWQWMGFSFFIFCGVLWLTMNKNHKYKFLIFMSIW